MEGEFNSLLDSNTFTCNFESNRIDRLEQVIEHCNIKDIKTSSLLKNHLHCNDNNLDNFYKVYYDNNVVRIGKYDDNNKYEIVTNLYDIRRGEPLFFKYKVSACGNISIYYNITDVEKFKSIILKLKPYDWYREYTNCKKPLFSINQKLYTLKNIDNMKTSLQLTVDTPMWKYMNEEQHIAYLSDVIGGIIENNIEPVFVTGIVKNKDFIYEYIVDSEKKKDIRLEEKYLGKTIEEVINKLISEKS